MNKEKILFKDFTFFCRYLTGESEFISGRFRIMKNVNKKLYIAMLFFMIGFADRICASSFFSGYAGGKLNYSANSESASYDPDLKLQAFFAGQFNFNENVWSHLEFSVDTSDLITEDFFTSTPSLFQIDELSIITRTQTRNSSNYFSAFMGTYDPIGSDVFLQRYFSINSITSKLSNSYLGLAGSIIYPQFGFGIADVIKFYQSPFAVGAYLYFNHEDLKFLVFNADLRAACVYRYFTCDFALGLGIPLADNQQDYIIAVEKLYWHAGTTMLLGNDYTTSLFIQAGLYNATFNSNKNLVLGSDDIYFLIEPRFLVNSLHINLSFYSLPPKTVRKMLFVEDTLGFDANFYSDSVLIGGKNFSIGTHLAFSFTDKSILDLSSGNITDTGYNIDLTPYLTTDFLSGELHIQGKIKLMAFAQGNAAKAFSIDVGYRSKF